MLSRQAKVIVAGFVATTVLILLFNHEVYNLDRYSFTGNRPEEQEQLVPADDAAVPPADDEVATPQIGTIDWSRYAYAQYVTNSVYLCNAVMVFAKLHELRSQADRVLMYPGYMMESKAEEKNTRNKQLLTKARDEYNVKIVPIEVQHRHNADEEWPDMTWTDSYTKLLAFNQTGYDRILAFDSDALLMQSMDELFLMPSCTVAMPRAYWLMNEKPPKKILSTHIMLLEPSEVEFKRLQKSIDHARYDEFDMELVNNLYLDSAAVLPHRPYALLTAEFRAKNHKMYLGSDVEQWDPEAILEEAKLIHFSDWPVHKPWLDVTDSEGLRKQHQPECRKFKSGREDDCRNRDIWNSLYAEFRSRRKNVCDLT